MLDIKERLELFISELKKEEDKILQKHNFCKEHNLKKESQYLQEQKSIIFEIRSEAELILTSSDYRPRLMFNA